MIRFFALIFILIISPLLFAQEEESGYFENSHGINNHYLTLGGEGSRVVLIHGCTHSDRRMYSSSGIVRELGDFQNVVLPGKSRMTAIAVGGPMPQLYIDALCPVSSIQTTSNCTADTGSDRI